jgi:hypothetical protein
VASPLVCQTITGGFFPQQDKTETARQSAAANTTTLAPPVDLHPDYGVISGKHYVNSYFGFSYQYPDGWNGNAIQSSGPGTSEMYAMFTANPASSNGSDMRFISINADVLGKNVTAKDFVDATVESLAGHSGAFNVLHSDKHYMFAGKPFYRVDLASKPTPGSPQIYQTQVFALLNNYAVTFSFMAGKVDDIDVMIHSMESLEFVAPDPTAPVRDAKAVTEPKPVTTQKSR